MSVSDRVEICRLQEEVQALRGRIELLTKYKRLQAEDIMTLGQQVGKLETERNELIQQLKSKDSAINGVADEIERLHFTLRAFCTLDAFRREQDKLSKRQFERPPTTLHPTSK